MIAASQNLTDFHPDVLGNTGAKIIFRTNHPVSKKVAGLLSAARHRRPDEVARTIESLEVGEAVVQTAEMDSASRVRMHPPP